METGIFLTELLRLFGRDIRKVIEEINAYPNQDSLWKEASGISNPGGNLALHLAGNLQHFIGATLGNTGYIRHREAEFSTRGLEREKVIRQLEAALTAVEQTLPRLTEADLNREFPFELAGQKHSTSWFLMHLLTHLNYHLGQINYHRRLVA